MLILQESVKFYICIFLMKDPFSEEKRHYLFEVYGLETGEIRKSTIFVDGDYGEDGVVVDHSCEGGEYGSFEVKRIMRWMGVRGGDSNVVVKSQMVPG